MKSLLESEQNEVYDAKRHTLAHQALWVFLHTVLALETWLGLMMIGYAVKPAGIPQWVILLLSLTVPLAVGLIVTKMRPDEMATVVWLVGVIWVLVFSLYLLDLPTGPGQCLQCSANEKLARSFLSVPRPSGLIDDDTPFLATWPAAALIGYSIGAGLGMRRRA